MVGNYHYDCLGITGWSLMWHLTLWLFFLLLDCFLNRQLDRTSDEGLGVPQWRCASFYLLPLWEALCLTSGSWVAFRPFPGEAVPSLPFHPGQRPHKGATNQLLRWDVGLEGKGQPTFEVVLEDFRYCLLYCWGLSAKDRSHQFGDKLFGLWKMHRVGVAS